MPARFDVFLSHTSADKPLVEELTRRLVRENVRPWLDSWNLIPGAPWQPAIEAALNTIAASYRVRKILAVRYGGVAGVGSVVLWDVATRQCQMEEPLP